jgi:hypothetical protein
VWRSRRSEKRGGKKSFILIVLDGNMATLRNTFFILKSQEHLGANMVVAWRIHLSVQYEQRTSLMKSLWMRRHNSSFKSFQLTVLSAPMRGVQRVLGSLPVNSTLKFVYSWSFIEDIFLFEITYEKVKWAV